MRQKYVSYFIQIINWESSTKTTAICRRFCGFILLWSYPMKVLLVRFLEQNNGKLSKRALQKEFTSLTPDEVSALEAQFNTIFMLE